MPLVRRGAPVNAVDRNGCELVVGDRVRFYAGPALHQKRPKPSWKGWYTGIVRRVTSDGEVVCDNGRPADPNPATNGMTVIATVTSGQVEVDRG